MKERENEKEKRYTLKGETVVSFWGGGTGAGKLQIETDESGLERIKKEPLQDYTSFGVESVDYVCFKVYLTEIERKNDMIISTEYLKPVSEIKAGKLTPRVRRVLNRLKKDEPEPIMIFY